MKNHVKVALVLLLVVLLAFTAIPMTNLMASPPSEEAEDAPVANPAANGPGASPPALLYLKAATFDPLLDPAPQVLRQASPSDYYILQFQGPIQPAWLDKASAEGAVLFGYIPEFAFIARISTGDLTQVKSLDCVRAIIPYEPGYKFDPSRCEGATEFTAWVLEEAPSVIASLSALGLAPEPAGLQDHTIVFACDPGMICAVAQIPQIEYISPKQGFKVLNSVASDVIGADYAWGTLGLDGTGETVAIADTGLDTGVDNHATSDDIHRDFDNRVTFQNYAGTSADDEYGHGTHVAGSVAGNGARSMGSIKGMAYNASLVIQGIYNETLVSLDPPSNISTLFQDAYDEGARVHTNSWGMDASGNYGDYDTYSRYVDEFIWQHPNMTILFAVGNDGADSNSNGIIDLDSILSPSTAKNCISVGASENDRPTFVNSYGTGFGYTTNPIRTDTMANNTDGMAAFSSRGPCQDNRIKPDVVAPGTYVLSTQSSKGGLSPWAAYNTYYYYLGGTSMATPITAGAATLVRQWVKENYSKDASSALTKALLVGGAQDMYPGQYGGATKDVTGWPDNNQGWGRINVAGSLDQSGLNRVVFDDNKTGVSTSGTSSHRYGIISSGQPLEVTLVWSDFPATTAASVSLVNDLDLTVTGPSGSVYWGSDFTSPYNDVRDRRNNIETVLIDAPATGFYYINVSGYSVARGPQPFALVVRGAVGSSLGNVTFDQDVYVYKSLPRITLRDVDLLGAGSKAVSVYSTTDPIGEIIPLAESPANSGIFSGTVKLTNTPPGLGEVQVTVGDILYARYTDASPAGLRTDTSLIGYMPFIINVTHDALTTLTVGDVLGVTLIGEPGYTATFSLIGLALADNRSLYDDGLHNDGFSGDGTYGGSWTIPAGIYGTYKLFGFLRDLPLDPNWKNATDPVIINCSLPQSPKGLSVMTLPQGNELSISWNMNPELNIAHYTVFRNVTPGPSGTFKRVAQTAGLSFTDTGLMDGVMYFYRLSANNTLGYESGLCAAIGGTPWDSLGPTITFVKPQNNTAIGGKYAMNYLCDPDTAMLEISYYLDTDGDFNADDGNSWVIINITAIITGTVVWDTTTATGVGPENAPYVLLKAVGQDEVPNMGLPAVVNVTVDNVKPSAPVLLDNLPPITNQHDIALSGKAEGLGFVLPYLNAVAWPSMFNVTSTGNFTANLHIDSEAQYTVSARAFDRAMNGPSVPSNTLVFYTDYTNPIALTNGNQVTEIGLPTYLDASTSYDPHPFPGFEGLANFTWSFTEGATPIYIYKKFAYYNFSELKNYTLILVVKDQAGNSATTSLNIVVQDTTKPKPDAGMNRTINEDSATIFDGSATTDNDPLISTTGNYTWSFFDGGPKTVTGIQKPYTFTTPGNYTVKLTVTDSSGNRANTTKWVNVKDITKPSASAGADIETTIGQLVRFNGSATKDNDPAFPAIGILTWSFVLGGKTVHLSGLAPEYQFNMTGNYTVTLNATDPSGNSGFDTMTVFVTADTLAPIIVARFPQGLHDQSEDTEIYVVFNEDISNASCKLYPIKVRDDRGKDLDGTSAYDQATFKFAYTPKVRLSMETEYTVTISKFLADMAGNIMGANYTWSFSTTDSPKMLDYGPQGSNVSLDFDNIWIKFTETITTNDVQHSMTVRTAEGSEIPGKVVLDSDILTFSPDAGLSYNTTYQVTVVKANITDLSGHPMKTDWKWEFTTEKYNGPNTDDDDVVDDDTGDDDTSWDKLKDNWMLAGMVALLLMVMIIIMIVVLVVFARKREDSRRKAEARARSERRRARDEEERGARRREREEEDFFGDDFDEPDDYEGGYSGSDEGYDDGYDDGYAQEEEEPGWDTSVRGTSYPSAKGHREEDEAPLPRRSPRAPSVSWEDEPTEVEPMEEFDDEDGPGYNDDYPEDYDNSYERPRDSRGQIYPYRNLEDNEFYEPPKRAKRGGGVAWEEEPDDHDGPSDRRGRGRRQGRGPSYDDAYSTSRQSSFEAVDDLNTSHHQNDSAFDRRSRGREYYEPPRPKGRPKVSWEDDQADAYGRDDGFTEERDDWDAPPAPKGTSRGGGWGHRRKPAFDDDDEF